MTEQDIVERLTDAQKALSLPKAVFREALSCGDMLDRFECKKCGAKRPRDCQIAITPSQIETVRNYINGYGLTAARKLLEKQNG